MKTMMMKRRKTTSVETRVSARVVNPWYLLLFVVLVLGGGWTWWNRVPLEATVDPRTPQPAVGYPAPDFSLTTLEGEPFLLSDQAGTPVVLNFWATWCGPCRRELPALQLAAERWEGEVLIVGVDQAEEAPVVQRYVDELGLTFPIPMDTDSAVAERFNVMGLPTTFFIDGDGVIRTIWTGEMNSITLAEHIAQIVP